MNNTLNNAKTIIASTLLLSASGAAIAHTEINNDHCDVELNYDLTISPDHILIIDEDETLVDIYKDTNIFVKGNQISLTTQQQQLVTEYAQSIRKTVPQAGELAVEAIGLAYEGIDAAFGQHVDLSASREKFDVLEQRIAEKFNNKSGNYSFRQGEFHFDSEDNEIDVLVEDIVEDMMPQLIGGLLSNIGQAIANDGEGVNSFEDLGQNIEREIESKAEQIEQQAEEFCYSLKKVNDIETELVASNSQFEYLDVLKFKPSSGQTE